MNGHFTEETLSKYVELLEERFGPSHSEKSEYDFTRCMRADGSFYGTRGKCRKGSDAGAAEKKGSGVIGSATPAQKAAMENRATQMRNQNAQADRAALARKVAKEMGKDPASVEVAKEVEKRQKQMAKKRALYQEVSSRKTAWGSAQENLKKAQTQFFKVKKAVGNKKGPEAWELMQKANAALEKAEKQELKARDRYFSSAKRAGASGRVAKGGSRQEERP